MVQGDGKVEKSREGGSLISKFDGAEISSPSFSSHIVYSMKNSSFAAGYQGLLYLPLCFQSNWIVVLCDINHQVYINFANTKFQHDGTEYYLSIVVLHNTTNYE